MNKRSRLKCQVMGFCIGLLVAMGFTILGLKIDIKIISMYDYNPWGISFTLVFLCVGLITGWIVETRTTRRLVREDVEKYQRRECDEMNTNRILLKYLSLKNLIIFQTGVHRPAFATCQNQSKGGEP